ncbi:hypothetical protein EV182_003616, partial [Spiromyces aspiralis]
MSMQKMSEYTHYLVAITGAGRGLGKHIALQTAKTLTAVKQSSRLDFVLIGRDRDMLRGVADAVSTDDGRIRAWVCAGVDLGAKDFGRVGVGEVEAMLGTVRKEIEKDTEQPRVSAMLVQNAGTLGDLSAKLGEHDLEFFEDYYRLNLTSFTMLCAMFIKWVQGWDCQEATIVNISSLLAIEAHPYWSLYSTVKAARDHLMRVVAKEEGPKIQTLNYAPGQLDSDMQAIVRETLGDADQRRMYMLMSEDGALVRLEESARALAHLLVSNHFESGSH